MPYAAEKRQDDRLINNYGMANSYMNAVSRHWRVTSSDSRCRGRWVDNNCPLNLDFERSHLLGLNCPLSLWRNLRPNEILSIYNIPCQKFQSCSVCWKLQLSVVRRCLCFKPTTPLHTAILAVRNV